MRILHIIGTLDPASGGPAASVRMLIQFADSGNSSEVVTLDDPHAAFLGNAPFRVTALGPTGTRFGYAPKLIPWLRENSSRFDHVVVHGLWQFCGFAAWRAFAGVKPYYIFAHGMLDPYFKHAFPLKHMKKWLYWLVVEYWVLRAATAVLFTCASEATLARDSFWLHHWEERVVPYGASVPRLPSSHLLQSFFNSFPQLRGHRFLLFLGRIDRKKGCDLLVRAFLETAAFDPSLHLVMAGPDETGWRRELEREVSNASLSERVHWTGMLQGNQKWGAFASCEAFVLPSHQENFGIAVAEAMAFARPVLLSNKVNIAPEIEAAGAGIVEADTSEGTNRLLRRWIGMSPTERSSMSHNARACFQLRYDMEANVQHFEAVLEGTSGAGAEQLLTTASVTR